MTTAPTIVALMGFFTLATFGIPMALVWRQAPRWLTRAHDRRVAFHQAACDTLHRALAETPRDDANHQRLRAQFIENSNALRALAPQLAVPTLDAMTPVPLAA